MRSGGTDSPDRRGAMPGWTSRGQEGLGAATHGAEWPNQIRDTKMYKTINFHLQGIAPLLLHNGHLADPLNEWAKAMKEVSSKRKKTDDDHAELGRLEWHGGLYLNEDQQPIVPGENIEAMLIEAGRKQKLGKQFQAGVLSDGQWLIKHDGPKKIDALWADKRFRDRRRAKVNGGSSVMRTRPMFRSWAIDLVVQFLPELLNQSQVVEAMNTAGRIIGLGDYHPKFGRFEVATK